MSSIASAQVPSILPHHVYVRVDLRYIGVQKVRHEPSKKPAAEGPRS